MGECYPAALEIGASFISDHLLIELRGTHSETRFDGFCDRAEAIDLLKIGGGVNLEIWLDDTSMHQCPELKVDKGRISQGGITW